MGIDDIISKARAEAGPAGIEALSGQIAEQIKDHTPEEIDEITGQAAAKAKELS
ncbi:hypothetical protein [Occultella gossypii]|uniref:Uncharacterized protein n=1 Tax=Occultella gossypii TaxID=2800820 RepID=A0ABS7S5U8_9MICO|nr:hypothetical protein [Occultella gossypii]MBZ2195721.1 hypothetical protein [Occultella gossypii]